VLPQGQHSPGLTPHGCPPIVRHRESQAALRAVPAAAKQALRPAREFATQVAPSRIAIPFQIGGTGFGTWPGEISANA